VKYFAGGTPRKIGLGVLPASKKPYPFYDQNLQISLPYLWNDKKFGFLIFMTVGAGTVAQNMMLLLIVLSIKMKNRLFLTEKHTQLKTRSQITMPYYKPKWPKSIPHSWRKPSNHHNLWGGMYLYSPYKGSPNSGKIPGEPSRRNIISSQVKTHVTFASEKTTIDRVR